MFMKHARKYCRYYSLWYHCAATYVTLVKLRFYFRFVITRVGCSWFCWYTDCRIDVIGLKGVMLVLCFYIMDLSVVYFFWVYMEHIEYKTIQVFYNMIFLLIWHAVRTERERWNLGRCKIYKNFWHVA